MLDFLHKNTQLVCGRARMYINKSGLLTLELMLLITVHVSQSSIWERETTLGILSRKALTVGHNPSGGLGKLQAWSHQEISKARITENC